MAGQRYGPAFRVRGNGRARLGTGNEPPEEDFFDSSQHEASFTQVCVALAVYPVEVPRVSVLRVLIEPLTYGCKSEGGSLPNAIRATAVQRHSGECPDGELGGCLACLGSARARRLGAANR